jgi:hypothetical protein
MPKGEINDTIIQYYKNLFIEIATWRPKIDGLELPCLGSIEANWLERSFQEEEVLQAFLSMDDDKVPGLDSFTIAFFWSCWAIVKDDLMRVFHNFHEHELF